MGSFFAKALMSIVGREPTRILVLGLQGAGKSTMICQLCKMRNVPLKAYLKFTSDWSPAMSNWGEMPESIEFNNIQLTSWDSGRLFQLSPLYRHYCHPNINGIVYVVDSNDTTRISDTFCNNKKINLLTFGFIRKSFIHYDKNTENKWPIDVSNMIFNYAKYEPRGHSDIILSAKSELDSLLSVEGLQGAPLLVFANKQDLSNAASVNEVTDMLGLNKILQKDRKWHIEASCGTTGDGINEGFNWLKDVMIEQNKARRE